MKTGSVILITIITAVITSTVTFFGLRALTARPSTTEAVEVPALTGLQAEQAKKVLEHLGLFLTIAEQRDDPRIEAGQIAQQTPLEGSRVRPGSEVRVIVSAGAAKVEVPSLARLPLATALQMLSSAGLRAGTLTRQPSSEVDPNVVLSHAPLAGTRVAAQTPVNLVVSSEGEAVAVPSVVGKSLGLATQELVKEGFKAGKVTYGFDEDRRGGVVLRQTPPAGAKAPKGSEVNLVVNESD